MLDRAFRTLVAAVIALSLGGMSCPLQAQQQTAPCSDGAGMHHDTSPQKHANLTVCGSACLADLPDLIAHAGLEAPPAVHFGLPNAESNGFSVEVATPPPR
jgi:hypothetical protein